MTSRLAIATCADLPDGDVDDAPLFQAIRDLGIELTIAVWSDAAVDWNAFDGTVIRTTWDYTLRRAEFLRWVGTVPRLHNPVPVIRTNSDKTYLATLAAAGLPIVPTTFVEPGLPFELPLDGEYVIKPSVGAGSRGAGRFDAADPATADQARAHADALHTEGRTLLVQPYQHGVDTIGESALMFFDGVYSHSIRKGPMLAPNMRHGLVGDSLFIAENITARQADPAEIDLAGRVVAQLSADRPLLYARIDLLPTPAGPVVIEAETTEPSLFFSHDDQAASRFAAAIADRL